GSVARINVNGVNQDRPNQLRSPKLANPTVDQWFDITAFVPQNLGTPGNATRNSVRGPGFKKVDMSFFKDFPLHGRMTAQVRVEAFNLFDWPFFSFPTTPITQFQYTDGPPWTADQRPPVPTSAVAPAHPLR